MIQNGHHSSTCPGENHSPPYPSHLAAIMSLKMLLIFFLSDYWYVHLPSFLSSHFLDSQRSVQDLVINMSLLFSFSRCPLHLVFVLLLSTTSCSMILLTRWSSWTRYVTQLPKFSYYLWHVGREYMSAWIGCWKRRNKINNSY